MAKTELTTRQRRVFDLLTDGHKYTVIQIANALTIGDPRSDLRDLRKKGYYINEEWRTNREGTGQYKAFWIDPDDDRHAPHVAHIASTFKHTSAR